MAQDWKPDIQDASLIDAAKVNFIFDSAMTFLGETINVANDLKKRATNVFGFFIATSLLLACLLLLKCDTHAAVCKDHSHVFLPGIILLIGYFVVALVLVVGCLIPSYFCFRGNEPKNLLRTSMCEYDINFLKIGEVIAMQERITKNVESNLNTARWLSGAYIIAAGTPILSVFVALWI